MEGVAVKWEEDGKNNRFEWDLFNWITYNSPNLLQYIAKPFGISPCGRVLLMEYAPCIVKLYPDDEQLHEYITQELHREVGDIIGDLQEFNVGQLDENFVVIDYGRNFIFNDDEVLASGTTL